MLQRTVVQNVGKTWKLLTTCNVLNNVSVRVLRVSPTFLSVQWHQEGLHSEDGNLERPPNSAQNSDWCALTLILSIPKQVVIFCVVNLCFVIVLKDLLKRVTAVSLGPSMCDCFWDLLKLGVTTVPQYPVSPCECCTCQEGVKGLDGKRALVRIHSNPPLLNV